MRAAAILLAVASLAPAPAPAADDAPPEESAVPAEPTPAEVRHAVLVDTLADLRERAAEEEREEALLAEADALALVAEELLVEGEEELAAELLGEAIALFRPERVP